MLKWAMLIPVGPGSLKNDVFVFKTPPLGP